MNLSRYFISVFQVLIFLRNLTSVISLKHYFDSLSSKNCVIQIIWNHFANDATLSNFEQFTQLQIPYVSLNEIDSYSRLTLELRKRSPKTYCQHVVYIDITVYSFGSTLGRNFDLWHGYDRHLWIHVFITRKLYESDFENNSYFYSHVRLLDTYMVLKITGESDTIEDVGIICLHCAERVQNVLNVPPDEFSLDKIGHKIDSNKKNLNGFMIPVNSQGHGHSIPPCDGVIFMASWRCNPSMGLVQILSSKYNFTDQRDESEVGKSKTLSSWIISGGVHRNYHFRYWKIYFLDAGPARLIYCVDHSVTEPARLKSLFDPLDLRSWIGTLLSMISVTILSLYLARLKLSVASSVELALVNICQFLRQPVPHHILKRYNKITFLLLTISSISAIIGPSSLYETVITSQMVVPLPDHILPTYKSLYLAGYKIVWYGSNSSHIPDGYINHFRWKFQENNISDEESMSAMIYGEQGSLDQMLVHLLETAGETTRLFPDYQVQYILSNLKLKNNARDDLITKCFAQPEAFELKENAWYFTDYMANSFDREMLFISQAGIFEEFRRVEWHNRIRRTKRNYFQEGLEDANWTPLALSSKLLVVFWACGIFLSLSICLFLLEIVVSSSKNVYTVLVWSKLRWWKFKRSSKVGFSTLWFCSTACFRKSNVAKM